MMNEDLQKAHDSASLAARELRAALAKADAVEALVLLPLIQQTQDAAFAIEALMSARNARQAS